MKSDERHYIAEFRHSYGWCVCDTTQQVSNLATKARGEDTVYRPKIVAAYVPQGLCRRIVALLNEAEVDA